MEKDNGFDNPTFTQTMIRYFSGQHLFKMMMMKVATKHSLKWQKKIEKTKRIAGFL